MSKQSEPIEAVGYLLDSIDDQIVRIASTPSGNRDLIEIRASGVLSKEPLGDDGLFVLTLSPDAQVRDPSVPEKKPGEQRLDDKPTFPPQAEIDACVERKRQECREDPMVRNKDFCESAEAGRIYEFFCSLPKSPGSGSGGGWAPVV